MGEIDAEALTDSQKGLVVIFIVGITVVNVLLISVAILKRQFISMSKWLTLISLSIGDIFLALFTLVITARNYFENFQPTCSLLVSASAYDFLINFVYGVGLIVLAVEMVVRYKCQSTPQDGVATFKAFAYSAVPWIIGLIVVLPLVMAGYDWEECFNADLTLSRMKAVYGVSTILPACAALVACFVVLLIVSHPNHQQLVHQEMNAISTYPASLTPQHQLQHPSGHATTPNTTDLINKPDINNPTASQDYQTTPYYPQVGYPQIPNQYGHPGQYNAYNGASQQLQAPFYNQPIVVTEPSVIRDPGQEKNVLMLVSVVFFCCVMPYAVYVLSYNLNRDNSGSLSVLASTVLSLTFIWLAKLRSIITPLIWICSLSK